MTTKLSEMIRRIYQNYDLPVGCDDDLLECKKMAEALEGEEPETEITYEVIWDQEYEQADVYRTVHRGRGKKTNREWVGGFADVKEAEFYVAIRKSKETIQSRGQTVAQGGRSTTGTEFCS